MIRKGLAVVVILLFIGLALTPTTYADVDKPELEVIEEDVTPTPIVLVLQLINKLRNHKDIQNIQTEDDVLRIIEGDEELNSIYEQLSGNDCGCEEEISIVDFKDNPIICSILFAFVGGVIIFIYIPLNIMVDIFNISSDSLFAEIMRFIMFPLNTLYIISFVLFIELCMDLDPW